MRELLLLCKLLGLFVISVEKFDEVREGFLAYKNAVLTGHGVAAADLVNAATHDYFDDMVHLAICASVPDVGSESALNRMQIALLRHRIPTQQLAGMSGTEVFVYAVDHGWVGKSSIAIAELGQITVSDNNAIASVVVGGKPAPGTEFRFLKENGSWRFDLIPVLASSSLLIQQLARQRGLASELL